MSRTEIPTTFIAFGATGDLMRRKVLPALFHLYQKNELPQQFRVVGFSRRNLDAAGYRAFVADVLAGAEESGETDEFLKLFHFQRGAFDERASYEKLKMHLDDLDRGSGVCSNKLFYFSVAPEFYETIFHELSASKLMEDCDPAEGWTRIMVEKPFGTDSATAERLDMLLGKYFEEPQIYRIDHYLAKEMLQNILTFRFSNNLFEIGWGKELIERIDIRLFEDLGVEKRGAFYDAVGALRDVGQNHFLQMLALLTMEHPESYDAGVIQTRRAEVLEQLLPPDPKKSLRAQYEGYSSIAGVAPDSETETAFRAVAELDIEKWRGVPITMEGGKRLGKSRKEIIITFRHPAPCLCPPGPHHKNRIVIRLEPKEEILIEFWSRKPGFGFETEPRMFHFLFREPSARVQYVEEYARLLLDGVRGDQTLFVSTREVQAMWRFADALLAAWKSGAVPLQAYAPDTSDILEGKK